MSSAIIQPYLDFSGRCEEALDFYEKALGAKVDMVMHFKDSPEAPPPGVLQPGFENKVMHASFRIGGAVVMATDGCDDKTKFSGISLSLTLPSEAEAKSAFAALSDGGKISLPIGKTFWSPCFGMVTDRFGVSWMVTVPMDSHP